MIRRHGLPNIFLILMAFLLAAKADAGNISIAAEVSRTAIPFEARDTLTVTLTWDGDPFQYQISDFPLPELDKLKILGSSSSVSSRADAARGGQEVTVRTYRYVLEPTDFGTGVIRQMDLTATNRTTNAQQQLQTGRLTVEIAKPMPRSEKKELPGWAVVLIVALGAIISGAGLIIIRRRRVRKKVQPQSADKGYLESLKEIKKETVADGKLFYSRLYRLLLSYIEKERKLELSGKTGEEVLEAVAIMDNDQERTAVGGWLEKALKVKYRPEAPSPADIEDTYRAVYAFFERQMNIK